MLVVVLTFDDLYYQVKLVDKRGQEYTPPPQPSYVAFSGEGQTMG